MKTGVLFFMLGLALFSFGQKRNGIRMYLTDEKTNQMIAYSMLGQNGTVEFTNLDPGSYIVSLEIPENIVQPVYEKVPTDLESDITAAYNSKQKAWYWRRSDGIFCLHIRQMKNATAGMDAPLFNVKDIHAGKSTGEIIEESVNGFFNTVFAIANDSDSKSLNSARISAFRFTVYKPFGTFIAQTGSVSNGEFRKQIIDALANDTRQEGVVAILSRKEKTEPEK
ncbi:MAG TPA: hypothetical protein PLK12_07560 [Prolixibacteraceae bacterium]|nr:hypothetical protein [Prolixibacteraceae bacterium]